MSKGTEEKNMNNRFNEIDTYDIDEALQIYRELNEKYEDVRMEKFDFLPRPLFTIKFRFEK